MGFKAHPNAETHKDACPGCRDDFDDAWLQQKPQGRARELVFAAQGCCVVVELN